MGGNDSDEGPTPRPRGTGPADRTARLKAALRANVGKRKGQARALGPVPEASGNDGAQEDMPCVSTM